MEDIAIMGRGHEPRMANRLRTVLVLCLALALIVPPVMMVAPQSAQAGGRWGAPAAMGAAVLFGLGAAAILNSQRNAAPRYYARPRVVAPRPYYAAPKPAPSHRVAHAVETRPAPKAERHRTVGRAARAAIPAAAASVIVPALAPAIVTPAVAGSAVPQMAPAEVATASITGPSGGSFH